MHGCTGGNHTKSIKQRSAFVGHSRRSSRESPNASNSRNDEPFGGLLIVVLLVLQFSDKFSPLISALICEPAFQVIFGRCQDFLILSVHWPSREAAKPCLFNPGFWGSKQFLGEKRFWANLIGAVAGKSGGRGEAKSCLPNLSTTRNRKNLSLETNRKREPENQKTKLLKLETRNRKNLSLETNRNRITYLMIRKLKPTGKTYLGIN